MVARKYGKLCEPFNLKGLTLKNRIVKSAQWLIYVCENCAARIS